MGATANGDDTHPHRWVTAGAIISLLESTAMLSTVSVGLSMYNCAINTSNDVVWQMVRLYYFSHETAGCAPYVIRGNEFHLDGVNKAALRTIIIMGFYTALYCIWFIGSILLLVSGIKGKEFNPYKGRNFQYAWTIPLILIIILDLIATILYCVDLVSTVDYSSVMGLLSIKPDGEEKELPEEYLSEPPKIMALLASKAGFLWCVNVVMLIILLKQFQKLYLQRKQQEFVRAQMASTPAYLWPPKLAEKTQQNGRDSPRPIEQAPTLPRLMNQDGVLVKAPQTSGTMGRPSAARHGFTYEQPNRAWSPTNQATLSRGPRMSVSQKYGYSGYSGFPPENNENWYSRNANPPARENDRPNNILQRDNDVFY